MVTLPKGPHRSGNRLAFIVGFLVIVVRKTISDWTKYFKAPSRLGKKKLASTYIIRDRHNVYISMGRNVSGTELVYLTLYLPVISKYISFQCLSMTGFFFVRGG